MDIEGFKQRISRLHDQYLFSRVELAKIMFIVSTMLVIVSIPAALSFQSAANQAESVNNQLSQTEAILESDRVQTSLEVLRNTQGTSFDQLSAAIDAFERSENSINKTETLQADMERNMEMYQWLVLIGIIGEVAAAAIFLS